MHIPKSVNYAFTILLIGFILILLLGQLLGQPVLIFVETDSMEPALEPGDGYVAVPNMFAGEIEEGDVILFDAQELHDGEPTTHRVEEVTEEGYITKGDANPFTDQDGPEPVVAEGQVMSVALQPTGDLLVIPQLGVAVETVSGVTEGVAEPVADALGFEALEGDQIGLMVLGAGLVLLIVSMVFEGGTAVRSRIRQRKGLLQNVFVIIAILTLVVIIPLNVSMLMPSGVYSFEIVSSSEPSETAGVIEAGNSEEIQYVMQNNGHLPVIAFLEPAGPGVEIQDEPFHISRQSSIEVGVTMHAPEETGPHLRMVQEHRYLMVLPPSLIATLHEIHPFAALLGINVAVTVLVALLTVGTLGTGRDRTRERTRNTSGIDSIFR